MKKKNIRKFIVAFVILTVIISAGILYLNEFLLPVKIKALILQAAEKETGHKASLESVQFNIFKGLVLRNFVLYDGAEPIISIKEGSCSFLILPIFKENKIIIPGIKIISPIISLERKIDGTLNLKDLIPIQKQTTPQKSKFSFFIYRISIFGGQINFMDSTLSPPLIKSIGDLNFFASLSLPTSVKYTLKSKISGTNPTFISLNGVYKIPEKQLIAKITVNNISPKEYSAYYKNLNITTEDGIIDSSANLNLKDDNLNIDLESQNRNLNFSKEKISIKSNSSLKANLRYNLKDKKLDYSGMLTIINMDIAGIDRIDTISGVNGVLNFNPGGLSSDKIKLNILSFPLEAKLKLTDFTSVLLDIGLTADIDLNLAQKVLSDKLNVKVPAELKGSGKLSLDIESKLPVTDLPKVAGSLDISNSEAKLDNINEPLKNINGHIDFGLDNIRWKNLNIDFSNVPYTLEGSLDGFKEPSISLKLSSADLNLESEFQIKEKIINASKLKGKYLNSDFAFEGSLDISKADVLAVKTQGGLNISLEDLAKLFPKLKDTFTKIKPSGIVHADVNLNGNIKNFKTCQMKLKLTSPAISLWGLNSTGFFLTLNQAESLVDVPLAHLDFYEGAIEIAAKANLESDSLPYWITIYADGIKIEKLKLDTAIKDNDIAGTIQAQLKLNGFSNNLDKLSGGGKIFIKEGKLWQLNLFKGIGELLFTKDFANIVFNEGSCEFFIKDKTVFTENLKLRSNFVNLAGAGKIGFDSSLDAAINVELSDPSATSTGTFKDVIGAIIGQAGKFAVIKLKGTLQKPEYKLQPAVGDVIKSLKDFVIGNIFQQ